MYVINLETKGAVERWAHEAQKVIATANLEGNGVVLLEEIFPKRMEECHE